MKIRWPVYGSKCTEIVDDLDDPIISVFRNVGTFLPDVTS